MPWASHQLANPSNPPLRVAESTPHEAAHVRTQTIHRRTALARRLERASNFDLTEYVWWKLLTELADEEPTIALLSKSSVARRAVALALFPR